MNTTVLNTTIIDPGDLSYVPFEVWAVLFVLTFIFFFHSILFKRFVDATAAISTVLAGITAYLSGYIEFYSVESVVIANQTVVQPVSYISHPPWLAYLMLMMFFVGIVNTLRAVHVSYFKKGGDEDVTRGRV